MSNENKKPAQAERDPNEVSDEDLESVNGGAANTTLNHQKSASKNADAVRKLL